MCPFDYPDLTLRYQIWPKKLPLRLINMVQRLTFSFIPSVTNCVVLLLQNAFTFSVDLRRNIDGGYIGLFSTHIHWQF